MVQEMVIVRHFNASRDRVWRAWTEADRLKRWWGPKGMEMVELTLDLRPGGKMHYGMKLPTGEVMWGRFVYDEIIPLQKLMFVVSFSDEAGGITKNPFAEVWPAEVMNVIEFADGPKGGVDLTLRGWPVRCSDDEAEAFQANFVNLQQGFKGTLDALEAELASRD